MRQKLLQLANRTSWVRILIFQSTAHTPAPQREDEQLHPRQQQQLTGNVVVISRNHTSNVYGILPNHSPRYTCRPRPGVWMCVECVMSTNLKTRSRVDAVQRRSCLILVGAALSRAPHVLFTALSVHLSLSSIQVPLTPATLSAVRFCSISSFSRCGRFLLKQ